MLVQLFPVLAYSHTLENSIQPISNTMDTSYKFSLKYNSTVLEKEPEPRWKMTVWIEADPSVLQNIERVSYHLHPSETFPEPVQNISSPENKFALQLNVIAGPRISATVYFKDNHVVTAPLLRTFVTGSPELFPIELTIDPKLTGLNIIIDGKAIAKEGEISKISVDWGDGNSSEGNFPFSHKYSKTGPYTINVTAQNSFGIFVTRSVQTNALLLEKNIQKESSFRISAKENAALNVATSSPSIPDNTPITYTIRGTLSSLNGSDVNNQTLLINLLSVDHPELYNVTEQVYTKNNGNYEYKNENLNLRQGTYKILVKPTGPRYTELDAAEVLIVLPQPLTSDQLIQYLALVIGIGGTIIGATLKVPNYLTGIKHSKHFSTYIEKINNKYKEFNNTTKPVNKKQYLDDFDALRSKIIYMLERGDINEDQYKMLDDKVSDYLNKIITMP